MADFYTAVQDATRLQAAAEKKLTEDKKNSKNSCDTKQSKTLNKYQMDSMVNTMGALTPGTWTKSAAAACLLMLLTF